MKYIPYVFCLLICIILLFGTLLQNRTKPIKVRKFSFLIVSVFLFAAFSLVSDALDGHANVKVVLYLVNFFLYPLADLMILAFLPYLKTLLTEEIKKSRFSLTPVVVLLCARFLITFILFATKQLFLIDDNGCYIEQSLSFIPYILSALIMFTLIIYVIINRKCFSNRQVWIIVIYEIIPVIPIILEMVTGLFSLTSIGITTSLLLVYVLIQDSQMEQTVAREALLEELSNKDLLTGLNNRRSFYAHLEKISKDSKVGIIFTDLNGLKYTNDHFGHAEGDELIVKYSKILESTCGHDNVFRISGDEFITLVEARSILDFTKAVASLTNVIISNNYIAAIGSSYGTISCIETLLTEAEQKMYKDKELNSKVPDHIDSRLR